MIRSDKQTGYILLPVIVVITLVAAIALLMNTESALESNTAGSELDARQAQYVAEAGMNHALWLTAQKGCGPYSDLTDEPLGNHKYTTQLTTDLGSTTSYSISVDQDSWIRDDNPTSNHATDNRIHIRNEGGVIERSLLRYDLSPLPAQAEILSATAWFYVVTEHSEGPVDVHRITDDWTELDATWNSMNDKLDKVVMAGIPPQPTGVWVAVNLSAQLQAWVNGEPNYGITLNTTSDGVRGEYASRESANPPYLEVIVGTPPTKTAQLQATATLANGVSRTIDDKALTLHQAPVSTRLLQPDATAGVDTYLYEWKSTWNYGASNRIWVEDRFADSTAHGLIRFNLNAIPAGARITSARLELYQANTSLDGGPIGVYQVTADWDEGVKSGALGESSWTQRDATQAWANAGGDIGSLRYALETVPPGTGWSSWEIGALVDAWVGGRFANQGLLLYPESSVTAAHFASSDDTDPTLRPKLSITYACVCGEICVAPQGEGKILMVVVNPTTLVAEDQQAKDLFESWGFTVSVISESANQSAFDFEFDNKDVVFISESVNSNQVGGKLQSAPIGVVSQDGDYNPDLGLATGSTLKVGTGIDITDTDHYITRVFPAAALPVYTAGMEQLVATGSFTADQQTLAQIGGDASLVALEQGAAMEGGGNAAGRRVVLPLGTRYRFNWDYLNANGRLLVQRALAWGMGADKTSGGNLLLVVVNPALLNAQLSAKKALIESWGYSVNLIDESDSQANFDAAIAVNDVAYIPQEINSSNLGVKLTDAAIGVVNEEGEQVDELGISADKIFKSRQEIDVIDNTHYITELFGTGLLAFTQSDQSVHMLSGSVAPGLQTLGESFNTGSIWEPSLGTLDAGDGLSGGGTAAGRRVQLPWGGGTFDINQLTDDGRTIMRRAIEWGANVPDPADTIILSTHDSAQLGGLAFTAADLVEYDPVTDTATLFFDGANLFTDPLEKLQSAHVLGNGHIILSTSDSATLGGLSFTQADLVEYDPGSDTATLFFDGASLFSDPLTRISSAQVLGNGHIILSTWSEATLGGLTFNPAQLVEYAPATDTATLYFDGTTLFGDPLGKIVAVHVLESGHIVLSTWSGNTLGGLSFGEGDLIEYDPVADTAMLYFDGVASFTDPLEKLVAAHIKGDDGPSVPAGGGPVAHWKFDETTGTTAVDSVGGNNATLNGNPDWTTGVENGALEFDGSGDYAITDNNFTPPPVGTVMFWMKVPGSPGSHGRIFGLDDSWEVRHVTSGTGDGIPYGLVFDLGVSGVNAEFSTTVTVDTPNRWYFVTATYDTGNDAYQIFLDGALHKSGTYPSSLTMPAAGQLSMGTRTGSSNYFTGTLDDLRIYDRIVNAAEIADFYAASAPPPPGYTELYEPWSAIDKDTWEAVDLAPFGVPADAVVEVAVINVDLSAQRSGGVRALGSTLERRVLLHEAEQGGNDLVTMHVQADASSRIEHYSDDTNDISFVALGYWTGVSYTELFDSFSANASNSWVEEGVGNDGLGPNQVAEIAMLNSNPSATRLAGVRASGSAYERRFNLQEAESGGVDAYSMMVTTDASSILEVFAESNSDVEFIVLGYWSAAPGIYVENGVGPWNASSTSWETVDLAGAGVPANAVLQTVIGNLSQTDERLMGVRQVGSILDRQLDLHEAEEGGSDRATFHVNVDSSSNIESYSEASGADYRFAPVGWWVLSP